MILIFLYALSVGSYPRDILFSDEISTNGLSNLETIDSPIGETRSSVQEKELPSLFKEIIPLLSEIGDVAIAPAVEEEVADIPVEFIFFFRKAKGKIQARVDFVYGEVIYSTDPKHEVSTEQAFQVLRDTVEEKRVLDLFRMYRYQKNETGYERPLPSGEELYAFFRTELSVFRQFGEVRLGRKLQELYLDAHKHQPKIEVTETGSWLDIRFDVTGIEEQEIDHVLQSLLRNDAFIH